MDKQTFTKQLKELVAFKTLTGDFSENGKALDCVVSKLNSKAKIKRVQNKGSEMLIAGNTTSMKPEIGYLVHMDVVAGKDEQFQMKVTGNRARGRGVSDMKFSIVMGIELLNELIARNSKLSFVFVITTDEETGGFAGAYHLANKLRFRPKVLVVPDGGDNFTFVNKAKGVCQVVVTSKGSPAHASRPWMGKNALVPLIKLADRLLEKYEKNGYFESWKTTLNIGQIAGGVSINQVCPEAVMKLDFRFPETDSIERILFEVKTMARTISPQMVVETASTGLPTFTNDKLPAVRMFLGSLEEKLGKPVTIKPTFGASDARHFAPFNIPVLMTKPLGGDIHGDNEWVNINSCLQYLDGINLFLSEMERDIYGNK